ncbi:hypothetical protein VTJ83DRAFT_4304 [Remersonia thermophila]|uniref:STAS domain-containing protein n=1 Tax=Remersonia thermophila TaxID=72144 RepID=A0ABR4D9S4_9PEZI
MATSPTAFERFRKFFGVESNQLRHDHALYDDGSFVEDEPHVKDALIALVPTPGGILRYLRSLFPFLNWIFHYNLSWLLGDVIAGVTVGFIVVPQGMAYALLAKLTPEYGLYTSFIGFTLYWAFATSKDITIGTVAVMSTIVGNVVIRVQEQHPEAGWSAADIARSLSVICGAVILFLGLIRAGFVVEFIPLVAIASFMTGSAFSIAVGQVPSLLGIRGVNTRNSAYLVIIDTLKALPRSNLDAAIGLTALFSLYFYRWFCGFMSKRQPHKQKMWFFISTLRMAIIIVLYIFISWLINRGIDDPAKAKIRVLGHVPSGFQVTGAPPITTDILSALAPDIPTTIIVLLIEHIAISKSFGRINNYIIDPSQELVALGFTNLFGPFLGGYPATGSFSRTAIKSKAGVRTPLAGIFTAVIVILALYALTAVFFFIPMAGLSALIIHAVLDLISPPSEIYKFWTTSPLEWVIFWAGVFVSIFTNIENGIYVTMAASGAILLFRIAKSPGRVLGKVTIKTAPRDSARGTSGVSPDALSEKTRLAFVDVARDDLSNPEANIGSPYPGVIVYRFGEGLNYVNSGRHLDKLIVYIQSVTRRSQLDKFQKLGDRPWNDPGPRRGQAAFTDEILARPTLRAIILDFTAVDALDVTAAQALIDLRVSMNKYADPDVVEFHFAGVANPWARRALVASGFGGDSQSTISAGASDEKTGIYEPLIGVAEAGVAAGDAAQGPSKAKEADVEAGPVTTVSSGSEISPAGAKGAPRRFVPIYGVNRPYFHVDVETALDSVLRSLDGRGSDFSGRD